MIISDSKRNFNHIIFMYFMSFDFLVAKWSVRAREQNIH